MNYWQGLYLAASCLVGMLLAVWLSNLTDTFTFRRRIMGVLREIEERLDKLEGK